MIIPHSDTPQFSRLFPESERGLAARFPPGVVVL
jgi:hypothetical protein